MDTEIVELPELRGVGILHVGAYDTLGAAFDRLGAWMMAHQGELRGAPRAVYVDDAQTPPDRLRTWVAVPVSEDLVLSGHDDPVRPCALPGGRHVRGVHRGAYEGLATAWPSFMDAIEASGQELDGSRPCSEVYVSNPGETAEEDLVTELYQPIR